MTVDKTYGEISQLSYDVIKSTSIRYQQMRELAI